MIINTGQRTDIPAFYTPWFLNRLKDGFVMVRNPFHHSQVTCYALHPEVVDLICFCTKNPGPLLPYGDILSPFQQLWHVTITPYGKDIEPQVPDKRKVIDSFRTLSDRLGPSHLCWRYDPVLLWGNYDINYHIRAFPPWQKHWKDIPIPAFSVSLTSTGKLSGIFPWPAV